MKCDNACYTEHHAQHLATQADRYKHHPLKNHTHRPLLLMGTAGVELLPKWPAVGQ